MYVPRRPSRRSDACISAARASNCCEPLRVAFATQFTIECWLAAGNAKAVSVVSGFIPRRLLGGSSRRVQSLGTLLYWMGLSYEAVSLTLRCWGVPNSQREVYRLLQRMKVAVAMRNLERQRALDCVRTDLPCAETLTVKCAGRELRVVDNAQGAQGLWMGVLSTRRLGGLYSNGNRLQSE